MINRHVTVPGADLHYEIRGHGPPLLVIGSPMAAAEFAPLADALASDYTVITYDPRGHGASTISGPDSDATPDQRADDIVAILNDLGAVDADVFGSSGGAVTGLALVSRHGGRVRTLVAHEPPLLELLPDAGEQRRATEAIVDTFRTQGFGPAWHRFMVNAGFDLPSPGPDAPAPPAPSGQQLAEAARFFEHELRPTTRYLPDIPALSASNVVIGIGEESGHLVTYRTSVALADLLGIKPVNFPGDHGAFLGAPEQFADRLREVLAR
jgi:pimeloyl-ACP methyl ester carboxylesterase